MTVCCHGRKIAREQLIAVKRDGRFPASPSQHESGAAAFVLLYPAALEDLAIFRVVAVTTSRREPFLEVEGQGEIPAEALEGRAASKTEIIQSLLRWKLHNQSPPLTAMHSPVMNEAAGDARNKIKLATSRVVAARFRGIIWILLVTCCAERCIQRV